ncbi:zinc-binding dehydrogenase [Marinomonas rhizomae]|uniref:zinc-binding dehydrogenase n=1 Tax=Marinomonas rhizomae TaxID=491948 RepID=UPI001F4D5816|nr:zinc-binding dehydrogenase [Marinomonas rhizomae]
MFQNLVRHLEEGKIQPLVAQTYPLKEIVQAQTAFQKKDHLGKIVLTIKPS